MTSGAPGGFDGFTRDTLDFLRALERHNEKGWFEANRARYERSVRQPLAALVEEVDVRLATIAPEIVGDPKRSLFRIHRDVRFSNDKRPYKTSATAWFPHIGAGGGGPGARAAHGGAGFYLDIGTTTCTIGGGIWMPPRPTLARVRQAIDDDHASLEVILGSRSLRRTFGTLAPDARLTRMPRGYAADHPAADLLRYQSFTVGRALTEDELLGTRLPDLLAREFARLVPLVRWLNGALGLAPRDRR